MMSVRFRTAATLIMAGATVLSARAAEPVAATTVNLGPAGEGRRLYLKLNCYGCHGMFAAGGMGPNIAHADYGEVASALRDGEGGGMRSYRAYVTAADIANLAAYLGSIGSSAEPRFRDWWTPLPAK